MGLVYTEAEHTRAIGVYLQPSWRSDIKTQAEILHPCAHVGKRTVAVVSAMLSQEMLAGLKAIQPARKGGKRRPPGVNEVRPGKKSADPGDASSSDTDDHNAGQQMRVMVVMSAKV